MDRFYAPPGTGEDDDEGEGEGEGDDREARGEVGSKGGGGGVRGGGTSTQAGPDPGDLLAKGLRVADGYLDTLLELSHLGSLDAKDVLNLAKLLPSLNVIKRDNPDGDKLLNAPPEEVARKMADALGPEAIARALVDLVGEDQVSAFIKRAGRQVRAAKLK